ncbi:MAG: hypothetical protein GXO92_07640 [FCB group bacterium]|nr:hypothetical protein [FCB group bacterium]
MNKPISIVFDAYHLYHLPQFEPVIDLLNTDNRFDVYLTTSAEEKVLERNLTREILTKKGYKTIFAETETERAEKIRALSPDVFVCGWSRYEIDQFVKDSTLVCMIYHGIGVKPSYWRDNHPRLDLRFVEGPYRERQLRENGVGTDLVVVGFAKLDPIFNGKIPDQQYLLREMGLDVEKKTILYAPTFYPSSLERFKTHLAEQTKGYNLIIKLHMWSYFLDKFGGISLKAQRKWAKKLAEKYDHIYLVPPSEYNIVPLYKAADILLTEASSTIYEMMALNKPVIVSRFYRLRPSHRLFHYRLYRKRLDWKMSKEVSSFCIDLHKPKDLGKMLEAGFNGLYSEMDKREKYQREMLYKLDGNASVRIREALLDHLRS